MDPDRQGALYRRHWTRKFRDAFRGVRLGVHGESSFLAHAIITAGVVTVATWVGVSAVQWGILLLCITTVFTAEMFNSAIERLAQAIDGRPNPQIGAALDIAAAAVLLASIGAAVTGALIFGARFLS